MNKCKICGNLAPDGFTLCDRHYLETRCKTGLDKNMFLGGNFYERRNMREKIARWLRIYKLDEVEVDDPTDDGIVPWDKALPLTKDYWLKDAKELLTLITEEIEKVENPYPPVYDPEFYDVKAGFEHCRQRILSLLRPNVEYCVDCNGEAQVKLEDCPAHKNPVGNAEQ